MQTPIKNTKDGEDIIFTTILKSLCCFCQKMKGIRKTFLRLQQLAVKKSFTPYSGSICGYLHCLIWRYPSFENLIFGKDVPNSFNSASARITLCVTKITCSHTFAIKKRKILYDAWSLNPVIFFLPLSMLVVISAFSRIFHCRAFRFC